MAENPILGLRRETPEEREARLRLLDTSGARYADQPYLSETTRAGNQGLSNVKSTALGLRSFGRGVIGDEAGATKDALASKQVAEDAALDGPRVQSTKDVKGVGDAAEYVRNTLLSQGPNLALSLAGGGGGGLIGKRLAIREAEKLAAKAASKRVAAMTGEEATAAAAELAGGAAPATEALARHRLVNAATKGVKPTREASVAAAQKGGAYGAGAASVGMEAGQIAPDAVLADSPDDLQTRMFKAGVGSLLAGGIDAYPAFRLLNKTGAFGSLAEKEVAKTYRKMLARVAREAGGQAVSEGGTELAQTIIEKASQKWIDDRITLLSPEDMQQYVDATVAGGVLGFISGGGGASLSLPASVRASIVARRAAKAGKLSVDAVKDGIEDDDGKGDAAAQVARAKAKLAEANDDFIDFSNIDDDEDPYDGSTVSPSRMPSQERYESELRNVPPEVIKILNDPNSDPALVKQLEAKLMTQMLRRDDAEAASEEASAENSQRFLEAALEDDAPFAISGMTKLFGGGIIKSPEEWAKSGNTLLSVVNRTKGQSLSPDEARAVKRVDEIVSEDPARKQALVERYGQLTDTSREDYDARKRDAAKAGGLLVDPKQLRQKGMVRPESHQRHFSDRPLRSALLDLASGGDADAAAIFADLNSKIATAIGKEQSTKKINELADPVYAAALRDIGRKSPELFNRLKQHLAESYDGRSPVDSIHGSSQDHLTPEHELQVTDEEGNGGMINMPFLLSYIRSISNEKRAAGEAGFMAQLADGYGKALELLGSNGSFKNAKAAEAAMDRDGLVLYVDPKTKKKITLRDLKAKGYFKSSGLVIDPETGEAIPDDTAKINQKDADFDPDGLPQAVSGTEAEADGLDGVDQQFDISAKRPADAQEDVVQSLAGAAGEKAKDRATAKTKQGTAYEPLKTGQRSATDPAFVDQRDVLRPVAKSEDVLVAEALRSSLPVTERGGKSAPNIAPARKRLTLKPAAPVVRTQRDNSNPAKTAAKAALAQGVLKVKASNIQQYLAQRKRMRDAFEAMKPQDRASAKGKALDKRIDALSGYIKDYYDAKGLEPQAEVDSPDPSKVKHESIMLPLNKAQKSNAEQITERRAAKTARHFAEKDAAKEKPAPQSTVLPAVRKKRSDSGAAKAAAASVEQKNAELDVLVAKDHNERTRLAEPITEGQRRVLSRRAEALGVEVTEQQWADMTLGDLLSLQKRLDMKVRENNTTKKAAPVAAKPAAPVAAKPAAPAAKPAAPAGETKFTTSGDTGYRNRTIENARADATIAIASDFESAGERLTRNTVKQQGKQYIPVAYGGKPITAAAVSAVVKQLNAIGKPEISLNIAGNGIYTLRDLGNQQMVDAHTLELLQKVINSPDLKTKITSIRSGGQTGFDEAGIKAGQKLGIPTTVHGTSDWKFRTANGVDVKNDEKAFKARFATAPVAAKPASDTGPINVWAGSGENAQFSNLTSRPFTYEGHDFLSVEHAYQSLKSGEFDAATFAKYKRAGTKIPGNKGTKTAGGWNIALMKALVFSSFQQNTAAADALIATGERPFTHKQDRGIWATEFPKALAAARKSLQAKEAFDAEPAVSRYADSDEGKLAAKIDSLASRTMKDTYAEFYEDPIKMSDSNIEDLREFFNAVVSNEVETSALMREDAAELLSILDRAENIDPDQQNLFGTTTANALTLEDAKAKYEASVKPALEAMVASLKKGGASATEIAAEIGKAMQTYRMISGLHSRAQLRRMQAELTSGPAIGDAAFKVGLINARAIYLNARIAINSMNQLKRWEKAGYAEHVSAEDFAAQDAVLRRTERQPVTVAIAEMLKEPSITKAQRYFFQQLLDNATGLPEVTMHFFKDFPSSLKADNAATVKLRFINGHFNPEENLISLPHGGDPEFKSGLFLSPAMTLLHESIHAATWWAETHNPALAKELQTLFEQARIAAKSKGFNPNKYFYGLGDTQEFLAEAHSNTEFQAFLASVTSKDGMSLLTKLWNVVLKALGMPVSISNRSLLNDAFAITEKLAKQGKESWAKQQEVTAPARELKEKLQKAFFGHRAVATIQTEITQLEKVQQKRREALADAKAMADHDTRHARPQGFIRSALERAVSEGEGQLAALRNELTQAKAMESAVPQTGNLGIMTAAKPEKLSHSEFNEFVRVSKQVRAEEKNSDPDDWTAAQREAYDSGEFAEFSRLRGYSKSEIANYQRFVDMANKMIAQYGENNVAALDHYISEGSVTTLAEARETLEWSPGFNDDITPAPNNKLRTYIESMAGKSARASINTLNKTARALLDHFGLNAVKVNVAFLEGDAATVMGHVRLDENGVYQIRLNGALRGKDMLSTFSHEVGHIVKFEAFDNADEATQQAVLKEFFLWRKEQLTGDKSTGEMLASRNTAARQQLHKEAGLGKGKKLAELDTDVMLSFDEWFADNAARYMTTDAEALTLVGKFFKAVADKLRELAAVFAGKGDPNAAVKSFLDGLRPSQAALRAANAQAALSAAVDPAQIPAGTTAAAATAATNAITVPGTRASVLGAREIFRNMPAGMRYVLTRVVQRRYVAEQLRAAISDPLILKAMDSPEAGIETRVAVAYELWNAGQFKIGAVQHPFRAMTDAIMDIIGIMSNTKYFEQFLADTKAGHNQNPKRYNLFSRTAHANKVHAVGKALTVLEDYYHETVAPIAAKVFSEGVGDRLRNRQLPSMTKFALLFKALSGERVSDPGLVPSRQREAIRLNTLIAKAFEGLDEVDMSAMNEVFMGVAAESSLSPEQAKAYTQVRKHFDHVYDYLQQAGVGFAKKKNYFPIVMKEAMELGQMRDEFVDFFAKNFDAQMRKKLEKVFGDTLKGNMKARKAQYMQMLDELYGPKKKSSEEIADIFYRMAMGRDDAQSPAWAQGQRPSFRYMNEQLMDFVLDGTPAQLSEFANFREPNLAFITHRYNEAAARRAEFQRRFPTHDSIEEHFDAAKAEGASPEDLQLMRDYMDVMMGNYGLEYPQALKSLFQGIDKLTGTKLADNPALTRKIQGYILVYQNIRLLGLATLSSITDSLGIAVRSGRLIDIWSAYRDTFGALRRNGGMKAAWDMAQDLGVVESTVTNEALAMAYGGQYLDRNARQVNDWFFQGIGLTRLTQATRVASTVMAHRFLLRHKDGTGKHSARYLEELGLLLGDITSANGEYVDMHTGDAARDGRIRNAMIRFVDESILRPDASQRPLWMSDPNYQLLTQYKSFTYAFYSTVVKRMAHEFREGNYQPLMMVLAYVPIMLFAELAREFIKHGEDGDPRRAEWGPGDYAWQATQRTGLLGPKEYLTDALADPARGNVPGASFLGPTAAQARSWMGRKPMDKLAIEALPLSSVTKNYIEPAAAQPVIQELQ